MDPISQQHRVDMDSDAGPCVFHDSLATTPRKAELTSCISFLELPISFLEFKDVYAISLVNKKWWNKLIIEKLKYFYLNIPSSRLVACYVQQLLNFTKPSHSSNPSSSFLYKSRQNLFNPFHRKILIQRIRQTERSLGVQIFPFYHIRHLEWTPSQCEQIPELCILSSVSVACEDTHFDAPNNRFQLQNFKALISLTLHSYKCDNQYFSNSNSQLLTRIVECAVGLTLQILEFSDCNLSNVNLNMLTGITELRSVKFSSCSDVVVPNLVHLTALNSLKFYNSNLYNGELEKNSHLHTLEIRHSNILDIQLCDLNNLHQLRHLDLYACNKIVAICDLIKFTALQKLELLGTSLRIDINSLKQLSDCFPTLHHFPNQDGPWITHDPPREISNEVSEIREVSETSEVSEVSETYKAKKKKQKIR